MPLARKRLATPLLALLVAAPLAAQGPNRNVRVGLPGPARPEPASRAAFLIARPQYVLSYNAEKRIPHWVCWQLKVNDIGSSSRAPFEPAPDLPRRMAKVTSETDAPLEAFLWEDAGDTLTKDRLRQLAGTAEGAAVEMTTLDDLLSNVPEEDRPQFDQLAAAVKGQLSGAKVYKVGDEPEKPDHVVGKTSDGKWAGLKTTAVETYRLPTPAACPSAGRGRVGVGCGMLPAGPISLTRGEQAGTYNRRHSPWFASCS